MRKIGLSSVLAVLILMHTGATLKLEAGELLSPSTWFSEEKEVLDTVTFDLLYPTPFYKTEVFQWTATAVVSIAVAATTVVTMGATAVPGATMIGSMLGTTWTAGLATLGGGTLASGGFGMAGGAFVIAATTDLTIAGLASFIPIPENNLAGKNYTHIKIPLPKDLGSKIVLEYYDDIEDLAGRYKDGELSDKAYETKVYSDYVNALKSINPGESPYDWINGVILAYNMGEYEKSQSYLDAAKKVFSQKSSFLYYLQSLLNLVKNDIKTADANLHMAILYERDILTPYLLKSQIAIDYNQLPFAKVIIDHGLKDFDDENFQLNYIGGLLAYQTKDYKGAIEYFDEALENTTIDEIEAECKMWIAKCYKNLGKIAKANSWYKESMDELVKFWGTDHDKTYQDTLSEMFFSENEENK